MPKKATKKVLIKVQKVVRPEPLVDKKFIEKERSNWLVQVATLAAVSGLLVGGVILGYLVFSQSLVERRTEPPKIIIPESYQSSDESPSQASSSEPQSSKQQQEPEVILPKVKILETPTGYLNVRKGPGTDFEKISQVKPGESYDLVSEDNEKGWYEIRLDTKQTGWVIKRYAEKQ